MDKFRSFLSAAFGEFLWLVILIPILAISWIGFYTIARDVGIPPIFAAGMSAAFDGVAIFAARIGLKHRRKGFSGYLARITVLVFAALGAFVQSFHGETHAWIHAHSWIVWATAPVAACLAYELHLGWVHRKRLIAKGYHHPSAKSGFGPITWIQFPLSTLQEHRAVLRARRAFIAKSNLVRFELEEAEQDVQSEPAKSTYRPMPSPWPPMPSQEPSLPDIGLTHPADSPTPTTVPNPKPIRPALHSVPSSRPARKFTRRAVKSTSRPATKPTRSSAGKSTSKAVARDQEVRDWCKANGIELGFNGRVPIAGLHAYRAAHRQVERVS